MAASGWNVSYFGKSELLNCPINEEFTTPDEEDKLYDMVNKASKEIRKNKTEKTSMTLEFGSNGINLTPTAGGTAIYQPLSKIMFVTKFKEKAMAKTTWIVSYVACDEESRRGAPKAQYTCYCFKAKDEEDAKCIVHAADVLLSRSAKRGRPKAHLNEMTQEQLDEALSWWNDAHPPMYQYKLAKGTSGNAVVAGVLKFRCQVDPAVKAVSKMIRISSDIFGDDLVKMLGDKFNLSDVSFTDFAVYQTLDDGDMIMLDEHQNPISQSLTWQDPCEGSFSLKKLPKGLQREGGARQVMADAETESKGSLSTPNTTGEGNTVYVDEALGPLLPFADEDEDLLLSVMVSRQSGSGLGFKLTPSYLLQMCCAFAFLHRPNSSFARFLTKMTTCIGSVMSDNPSNPELLFFWLCNTARLISTFDLRQDFASAYRDAIGNTLENTLGIGLKLIEKCKLQPTLELPAPLNDTQWNSQDDLKQIVINNYKSLDSNMSRTNLQEVVERITAAMPSAHVKQKQAQLNDSGMLNTSSSTDGPQTSTPGGNGTSRMPSKPGMDPLPPEWEELTDQETRHRFFANHITRQTSWTDPRDVLTTVTLKKEQGRGLGLGLSGAKRTWDDRLILGIFVSSLVQNSAAAIDGTLSEGDEILEVNGHSLIGVSREGAIDFLKEIKFGETVTLLVSQEPDEWIDPDRERAEVRHTAL